MEEYGKTGAQEEEGAGRWLSCESDLGAFHPARRKRKMAPLRKPILLQKKLPKHWREHDDTLLTELDLLQPKAGALKQSSLMSFVAVGEKSKADHPRDLPRPQVACDIKTSPKCDDSPNSRVQLPSSIKSHISPNSQVKGRQFVAESRLTKLNSLSSDLEQGADDNDNLSSEEHVAQSFDAREPRCQQDSGSRRLMTLSGNRFLQSNTVGAEPCLVKDHHKDLHLVSVNSEVDIDTCDDEADVQLVEDSEVGVTASFEFSQNSCSSDEDLSDKFNLCGSDENFTDDRLDSEKLVNGSTGKKQKFLSSASEESFTFTNEAHDPCPSDSTLTESQRVRKEIYKAEMGSLQFSEFSDLS